MRGLEYRNRKIVILDCIQPRQRDNTLQRERKENDKTAFSNETVWTRRLVTAWTDRLEIVAVFIYGQKH